MTELESALRTLFHGAEADPAFVDALERRLEDQRREAPGDAAGVPLRDLFGHRGWGMPRLPRLRPVWPPAPSPSTETL